MNAVKHGLTAKKVVVVGENPEDFDAFRDGVTTDFKPGSTIESELVDQAAALLWRLRRWAVVEAELLKGLISQSQCYDWSCLTDEELEQVGQLFAKALKKPIEPTISSLVDYQVSTENESVPKRVEMLSIFSRYEAGLMNALMKTLTLLHSLRAARAAGEAGAKTMDGSITTGLMPLRKCRMRPTPR
jgi:hypothetical protein